MANHLMHTQLLQRRDLKSNWSMKNPILGAGEIGIETDTGAFKIGDGVTAWNLLGITASAGHEQILATNTNGVHGLRIFNDQLQYKNSSGEWVNHIEKKYVVYGIKIDETNANPETALTYTDDAVGMVRGSASWDNMPIFNEIQPLLLKDGKEQYFLNKSDLTKKSNGENAVLTGEDGDVFIRFTKFAYMIEREGTDLYVKITNHPDAKKIDPRFCYFGFTRDVEGDRDFLYVARYLGYDDAGKLRSVSGVLPTANINLTNARTKAQANGAGYDLMAFYPLTALQCLYLIKYKNRNSQIALGQGYTNATNTASIITGGANAKGMYFGEQTGKQQMVFAGIEDFWGNLVYWIDGIYADANWHILTTTKNFNSTPTGYIDHGAGSVANIVGYISNIQGNNNVGFFAKTLAGSNTTHWCDYGVLTASRFASFGGHWTDATYAGAFRLVLNIVASSSYGNAGARLLFL